MMKRLFIGVSLPSSMLQELEQEKKKFRFLSYFRWIPKENLHITVEFLGNVDEKKIPTLESALQDAACSILPFELSFEKICFGPPRGIPGMLWCQFFMSEDWKQFVAIVKKRLSTFRENHEFHIPIPHVTLARWKDSHLYRKMNLEAFRVETQKIPIESCNLYESELHQEGSQYYILNTFSFLKS